MESLATKPVRCVLEEILPRKMVVIRTIKRFFLLAFFLMYLLLLHTIAASHLAWVYQDGEERKARQQMIESGKFVNQGWYKDGSKYIEEKRP